MEIGILLPIFSLPSKYGIGDFGYEAYKFIDILKENGIKYWEILPINASGQYPYSPISYYALNENFISLDMLHDMGLLSIIHEKEKSSRIKYDNFKEKYYKEAYSNFKPDSEYIEFTNISKIREYATFMSKGDEDVQRYYLFLQYVAYTQWIKLKEYANNNGVKIIGDMPIYPDYNSSEIAYNSKYFELENGKMKYVSGASPDYFNSKGQKWGHPLYDFKRK